MTQPIGGYFNLELKQRASHLHSNAILVNSGRNALEYILSSLPLVKKVYLPYYTCEVVLEPLKKLQIPYAFYHVNEQLRVARKIDVKEGEYIIVNNYYGIMDAYINQMAAWYENHLIVDNAQAFFANPIHGVATFYSPRKFVGIPDGGMAIVEPTTQLLLKERDKSYSRCEHLLRRYDEDPSSGYVAYRNNSQKLVMQPMLHMSALTEALLKSIDYEDVAQRRMTNFKYLHHYLKSANRISSIIDNALSPQQQPFVPMVYPYWTEDDSLRQRLIDNHIYVAKYWPNIADWCQSTDLEYELMNHLIPLPIDQRYGEEEMKHLIEIIN